MTFFSRDRIARVILLFSLCAICNTVRQSRCSAQNGVIPNPFDYLPADNGDPQPISAGREAVPQATERENLKTDEMAIADSVVQPDAASDQKPAAQDAEDGPGRSVEGPKAAAPRNKVAPENDTLRDAQYSKAMLVDVRGPIFGRFHWYLNDRLDLAKRTNVDLLILRLTSPGGDLEYSLQLARRIRDIDWAKTIVFIPEEAISGGAIIALGADRIYMLGGALIGDAGPIQMEAGGQFEHAPEKVVSYLAGAVRELAEAKGRPGALAEAMVDRKLKVFQATDLANNETIFVTESQSEDPMQMAGIDLLGQVVETGQNRFLTVDADRALALKLCEGVFASEEDLLGSLSIEGIKRTELNWVDRTVFLLNRPWLTAILLIAGLVGLYLEFAAPGLGVAGLTALCCFSIFFWSHALGGTSGWLEILLFLLGVCCILCEIFLLPGFGIFGVCGALLVVLSLVMASQDFVIPDNAAQWTLLRTNVVIVLGAVLGVTLLLFGQLFLLDSLPGLNRFRLATPEGVEPVDPMPISALVETSNASVLPLPNVGTTGIAESDLRPSGKVRIDDQLVDVVSEGDYILEGTAIEVIKIDGNIVVVRKTHAR